MTTEAEAEAHRRQRRRSLADSKLCEGEREQIDSALRCGGSGGDYRGGGASVSWFAGRLPQHGGSGGNGGGNRRRRVGVMVHWQTQHFTEERERERADCFSAKPEAEPSARRLGTAEVEAWWFASSFREWGSGLIISAEWGGERTRNHLNDGKFFSLPAERSLTGRGRQVRAAAVAGQGFSRERQRRETQL